MLLPINLCLLGSNRLRSLSTPGTPWSWRKIDTEVATLPILSYFILSSSLRNSSPHPQLSSWQTLSMGSSYKQYTLCDKSGCWVSDRCTSTSSLNSNLPLIFSLVRMEVLLPSSWDCSKTTFLPLLSFTAPALFIVVIGHFLHYAYCYAVMILAFCSSSTALIRLLCSNWLLNFGPFL